MGLLKLQTLWTKAENTLLISMKNGLLAFGYDIVLYESSINETLYKED